MEKILNYINGEFCEPLNQEYIDNVEPATGRVYSLIPNSSSEDVEMAVASAQKAFASWSSMGIEKRSSILMKVADKIEARLDEFIEAESKDNGKPVSLARNVDIPRAISNFRFFATSILHFSSESHYMEGVGINYTTRKPIGIVGCISPWNLPLYLFSWKIAPALATGNCVIAKPSEITPYTAYLLSSVLNDAGVPPGVLNIVHGLGTNSGDAIVRHPKIKAISFTGGTQTGAYIAKTAAPMFKKLSLELGGKNPNVIFADCDFDEMLKTTVRSSFANQGQICLCGSRILIEKSIYNKFKLAFLEKLKSHKVSFPSDPEARMGAIVSKQHMEKVLSCIDLAKKEGGEVIFGGNQIKMQEPYNQGFYIEPTVIEGLPSNCRTNQEEIFGPVVTLIPFEKEKEAVEIANSTEYGLATTIWTSDLKKST